MNSTSAKLRAERRRTCRSPSIFNTRPSLPHSTDVKMPSTRVSPALTWRRTGTEPMRRVRDPARASTGVGSARSAGSGGGSRPPADFLAEVDADAWKSEPAQVRAQLLLERVDVAECIVERPLSRRALADRAPD